MKLKFDPYQFNTCDSYGVPVYWKNIPWANGFAYLHIIVGVGARHDPVGKEGLAHFFEHMPFDGCAGWPTFSQIREVSRGLFQSTLNASTNFERTMYESKFAVEYLSPVLNFMHNFLILPVLAPVEVGRERKVIIQEIWKAYGNERRAELEKQVQLLAYGSHPFGRQERAFGWPTTVERISHEELSRFHKTYYVSGNMKIVLVGDISESDIATVDSFTRRVPKGVAIAPPATITRWPNPEIRESITSAGQYFGLTGSSVPKETNITVFRAMPNQVNKQVLIVAHKLVRHILFEQIRGQLGASYSPRVYTEFFLDHDAMGIILEISPEAVDMAREIIVNTLAEIANGDAKHEKLFEELKRSSLTSKLFSDYSIEEIAENASNELASSGRLKTLKDDCDDTESVTYGDISTLFATEFTPGQLFWTLLTP